MDYFRLFPVKPEKIRALVEAMARLGIVEKEIEESFIRSSGPGGQKVNRRSSAVQLKYKGIVLTAAAERSQGLNRYFARKRLCALVDREKNKASSKLEDEIRRNQRNKARKKRRTLKKLNTLKKDELPSQRIGD